MEADSWSIHLSSASKRYQAALQTRSDIFMGFEEIDGDDDIREEFPCPFCSEYFDIVGLCIHLDDEHPVEAKNGMGLIVPNCALAISQAQAVHLLLTRKLSLVGCQVCPVCAMRAGVDMVAHITLQHGNIFKMRRKRKSRRSGSHSTLSFLRRELRDGSLQSLLGGSSCMVSSSNTAADPLLSSFILPVADDFANVESKLSTGTSISKESLDEVIPERKIHTPALSIKDQEERAKRCEFVRELLFSTVLDDGL